MTNFNEDGQGQFNLFFWLGQEGEAEPVSEAEFLSRQNKIRVERENFLNVRIPRSSDGIDVVGD